MPICRRSLARRHVPLAEGSRLERRLFRRNLAARDLDDLPRGVVARVHAVGDPTADGELREEAADESVARAVGVDELLLGEEGHLVLGDDSAARDERGVLALCEHHAARAVPRPLGKGGELEGDLLDVLPPSLRGKGAYAAWRWRIVENERRGARRWR